MSLVINTVQKRTIQPYLFTFLLIFLPMWCKSPRSAVSLRELSKLMSAGHFLEGVEAVPEKIKRSGRFSSFTVYFGYKYRTLIGRTFFSPKKMSPGEEEGVNKFRNIEMSGEH